jgi:hypothetical protein
MMPLIDPSLDRGKISEPARRLTATAKRMAHASEGFYILGGNEARNQFKATLARKLSRSGWPMGGSYLTLEAFVDSLYSLEWLARPYDIKGQKREHRENERLLHEALIRIKEVDNPLVMSGIVLADFLSSSGNLDAFDTAIWVAAGEVSRTYGNPFQVTHKPDRLKAARDAIKGEIFDRRRPESDLSRILRNVAKTIQAHRAARVPPDEFRGRMGAQLKDMRWPIEVTSPLADFMNGPFNRYLWSLEAAAEGPMSHYTLRMAFQPSTIPVSRDEIKAFEFILDRRADLLLARDYAAAEIREEAKQGKGHIRCLYVRDSRRIQGPRAQNRPR